MNKTSNQLNTVFQELNEYFANIPAITVTPGEGNPPDQYTVQYAITGVCKESEGEVYSCDNHVISISLPFGFPHFPPNCLPESPTFHPDFDSSAICIGDLWEAEKSIITLILHIAKMISGEIYSDSNAFNEEAAEWYKDNTHQLPFDTPDFGTIAPAPLSIGEDDFNLDGMESDLDGIDTLDDDDFGVSYSHDKDTRPTIQIDTDRLRIISKQNRFQALSRELQSINGPFEGRKEFEEQTQNAMDQAMAIYQEAYKLEHQGKQKEALEKYLSIENQVSDYPKLQEAKDRVQQAFDLLGDWVSNETDDQDTTSGGNTIATAPSETTDEATPDTNSSSRNRTFFEDTKASGKKLFLFALVGGSIALVATLIFTYFSLGSSLEKAAKGLEECQIFLTADEFRKAEAKCEEALAFTNDVRIVKQRKKEELARKIQSILTSPKLRQGLAGKTLLDGKYVTTATKELLLAFKKAKEDGDLFFKNERWDAAVDSYIKALTLAKGRDAVDAPTLTDINQNLPRAQFNSMMQAGEKSLAISDWDGAKKHFGKALSLAKANPNVLPESITELELLSNQAEFNSFRDQGHKSFKADNWDAALSNYLAAQELVEKLDLSQSDAISSLHEIIAKTKIYMTIENGKKAFAASEWDEAISQYEKAIILLEENSKLLSRIDTKESRIKLSRIMLHAKIIKDKQDIAKYLKSEEFALVINKLGEIQESIRTSQFSEQPEFTVILEEVVTQIKEAEKQLLLIEQTSYLIDNYEELFLKHYPAATRSALSAPGIVFLRNIGDKLLFRMQCTETAGGRPLRLQMDYLYAPSNKKWSFYTEQ